MSRTWAWIPALLACSALPAGGEEPAVKAFVGVKPQDARFRPGWTQPLPLLDMRRIRLQIASPLDAFRSNRKGIPGATVVIWGEASQARREEMQQFVRDFQPLFQNAFDAGLGSGIGGQMLGELMAHGGDPFWNPAPAHAPSVWYNAQNPWARDPRFYK